MKHSESEKLLVGVALPLHGGTIKEVLKPSENIRILKLDNGKEVPVLKSRVKSFVDAQLRKQYASQVTPLAMTQHSSKFQNLYGSHVRKTNKGR